MDNKNTQNNSQQYELVLEKYMNLIPNCDEVDNFTKKKHVAIP